MTVDAVRSSGAPGVPGAAASSSDAGFSGVLASALSGKTDLDGIFEAASQKYGVPVGLLKAVGKAESNFRPDATSRCGAMGVMQLMPATARSLGVTDAYDPEQNIMGGAKLLSGLLSEYGGNTSLALAAYNAGSGNVKKYGGIPPFAETQNYVKKVLSYCGGELTAGAVQAGLHDLPRSSGAGSSGADMASVWRDFYADSLRGIDADSLSALLQVKLAPTDPEESGDGRREGV